GRLELPEVHVRSRAFQAEKARSADEQPAIQGVAQREERLLEAVSGVQAVAVRPQVREQFVSADPLGAVADEESEEGEHTRPEAGRRWTGAVEDEAEAAENSQ